MDDHQQSQAHSSAFLPNKNMTFIPKKFTTYSTPYRVYFGWWRSLYYSIMGYPLYRFKYPLSMGVLFDKSVPFNICNVINYGRYSFHVVDKTINELDNNSWTLRLECTEEFDRPVLDDEFNGQAMVQAYSCHSERSTKSENE